jgi:Protein of unknown function (DUF3309)
VNSPLGIILVVILLFVLLGGFVPHVYTGAPWQPGYGFGNRGIGVVGVILIVVLILWLMGYV